MVELVLPQPFCETKEHNRYTRTTDAATLALLKHQKEQKKYDISRQKTESGDSVTDNLGVNDTQHEDNASIDDGILTSPISKTNSRSQSVRKVNFNVPEQSKQSNSYFYFEEEKESEASILRNKSIDDYKNAHAVVMDNLLQNQKLERQAKDNSWKDSFPHASANVAISSFGNVSKSPLPKVSKPVTKYEMQVTPISSEGKQKLLCLAVERSSFQYSKRHL